MDWSDIARKTLAEVAATVPDELPMKERKAIVEAAYPFGPREMWPYRTWRKACKAYYANFAKEGGRIGPPSRPTGLEHLPRDPVTGRPMIA